MIEDGWRKGKGGGPKTTSVSLRLKVPSSLIQFNVASVVYLDRTWEGIGADGFFEGRSHTAAEYRKSLAEEKHTPAEKGEARKAGCLL
jgi:hypothetical protein